MSRESVSACPPENVVSCKQKRLEGKVAIVTGGARGIGEATVRLFLSHGAKVVIADVDDQEGEGVRRSVDSDRVTYVHCDVSKEEDVSRAVDVAVEKYGQLDIMFNNAGIVASRTPNIVDLDIGEFDRVMDVNARGTMIGMKHAARVMIPRRRGSIISTASVAGVMGGLGPHAYTASKHAIIGLTKNVAAELGKYGIRVNSISPYGIATQMVLEYTRSGNKSSLAPEEEGAEAQLPTQRAANLEGVKLTVEDVAEAALYLASEESKYVSAHNLVLDGGVVNVNNSLGLFR